MLKLSFLVLVTSLAGVVHSAPQKEKSLNLVYQMEQNAVNYNETVDCGSVAQPELFRRARLWISQYAENKIMLADKETGDLVSEGKIRVVLPRTESFAGGVFNFRYTLTVECANRKYRSSIRHIEVIDNNAISTPLESFNLKSEKEQKELLATLDKKLKDILTDLQLNVKDYKAF